MWIVISVGLFLVAAVYLYRAYYSPDWKGRVWYQPNYLPREKRQLLERFQIKRGTNDHGGLIRLGIDCPQHFDFSFGRETWFDRLGKAIGAVREPQLGDKAFDESVFIGADDVYFIRLLKRSERARAAIQSLLAHYRTRERRLLKVHCRGGRLWLHCRVSNDGKGESLRTTLEADALDLNVLREALVSMPISLMEPIAKRIRRRAMCLFISCVALIVSAAGSWLSYYNDETHLLSLSELLVNSLIPAFLLWGALLGLCVVLLLRTTHFHSALVQVFFLGAIGSFGTVSSSYLHINIEHDQQQPIRQCSTVIDMEVYRSRRSTSFYVTLNGWQLSNGHFQLPVKWKVPSETYRIMSVGAEVRFHEHRGRFDYTWLNDLARGCDLLRSSG